MGLRAGLAFAVGLLYLQTGASGAALAGLKAIVERMQLSQPLFYSIG